MAGGHSNSRRGSTRRGSATKKGVLDCGWTGSDVDFSLEGPRTLKLELALTAGAVTVAGLALANYSDLLRLFSLFLSIVVPLFALLCGYSLMAITCRSAWSQSSICLPVCGCIAGEVFGFLLHTATGESTQQSGSSAETFLTDPLFAALHLGCVMLCTGISYRRIIPTLYITTWMVVLRTAGCLCLPMPLLVRSLVTQIVGLAGVFAAKYLELSVRSPLTKLSQRGRGNKTRHGSETAVHRHLGTCHPAISQSSRQSSSHVRRTSLPALLATKHQHQSTNPAYGFDIALLSEAHGLVTDLLIESESMPPHLVSGLKALGNLLSPPVSAHNHTHASSSRPRSAIHPALALVDSPSTSDIDEIPYMGEPLPRGKRFISANLLRRMSTSTWTTTTSATGMPTIEPEPCRKRTASFRNTQDMVAPIASFNYSHSLKSTAIAAQKHRSRSTTSLSTGRLNSNSFMRGRKTICSLYPVNGQLAKRGSLDGESSSYPTEELNLTNTDSSESSKSEMPNPFSPFRQNGDKEPLHENDVTSIIRCPEKNGKRTSDYESSDSPNSLENHDDIPFRFIESHENVEDLNCENPGNFFSPRLVVLDEGTSFDLEFLETNKLLDDLKEWDYPIFDLVDEVGDLVLSSTCYRVFLEVGLFETFRIPLQEFFHFFRSLGNGYRNVPYHNRVHASDVLHACYYLTSQPIPGFHVLPEEIETRINGNENASPTLTQRASFDFEDTYGIMGANFPALELMALYTAAAMHDYEHPGRTNAFLVSTLAPQAVLYNDRSVLENHHAAAAWSLFLSDQRFNFLVHLDRAEFKRFRYLVIEAILATDLKRHFEILAEFNAKVHHEDGVGIDWTCETDRLLVMQMCIKLADINGPCKSHTIHLQWTNRIVEEFYEQGDEEAALGLPISPFMDRDNPQLAKLQESFITHLVAPLCSAYAEAGLLPGVWDEISDEQYEKEKSLTESVTETEIESTESEASDTNETVAMQAKRKVFCLQTRHLKENHDYWIALIKEESSCQAGTNTSETKSCDSVSCTSADGRMDTIAED